MSSSGHSLAPSSSTNKISPTIAKLSAASLAGFVPVFMLARLRAIAG